MQLYTSKEDISKFRKAGKIAALAREFGIELIKPGVSLLDVSMAVEEEIKRLGGDLAFPAQISLNNVAAHYCASPEDRLCFSEGDVAKLDVGVHVDGYVGDTAATKDLGGPPLLMEASRQALENAIKIIAPGVLLSEVGNAINSTIVSMGYKPVTNLTGHAVGIYSVHGSPQIPNVPDRSKTRFEKGQVLAIEPFATTGKGVVREKGTPEIFSVMGKLKLKRGMDQGVLDAVAAYNGLPFGRRNLAQRFVLDKVNATIGKLLKNGALHGYAPLAEADNVVISQAEHTVYIGDELEILTLPD